MDGVIVAPPSPSACHDRAPPREAFRAGKLRGEAPWRDLAHRRNDDRQVGRMLHWADAREGEAASIEASWAKPTRRAVAA